MNTEQLFQKLEEIEDSIADFDDCEGLLSTVFELRKTLKDYELVPVEPTDAMRAAAHHEVDQAAIQNYGGPADPMDIWQAMIAAAQESEE